LDQEEKLLQDPRPLFKGDYKPSKVTGKLEPHYSDWKRWLWRYFVSFPCLIVTILITVALMLFMFELQEFFQKACDKGSLPFLFGLTNFIPKMIYAKLISGLNEFYKSICVWLNEKENYREELTHENHLIAKIVIVLNIIS
jgi:anoctamin-8